MNTKITVINETTLKLTENFKNSQMLINDNGKHMPSRKAIIDLLKQIRRVVFPGYFNDEVVLSDTPEYYVGNMLANVYKSLKEQVTLALMYENSKNEAKEIIEKRADCICSGFFGQLPNIQKLLLKDVQAAFNGDPAANSMEEIIFSYPGLFAIYVYRIARILYQCNVPFIPRIMTEYAHGKTGIDINSGAEIGEYFFIDHGTGIVIGETCVIGNNVKIYQGVTLGALSTRSGQLLKGVKRHPTICDNVTIYSGATVLGGETVIGENVIIGGNCFITESIAPCTKVSAKPPELIIKNPKPANNKNNCWEI